MSVRLSVITNHLSTKFPKGNHDDSLNTYREKSSFLNKRVIHEEYLGPHFQFIDDIRNFIASNSLFNFYEELGMTTDEMREKGMRHILSLYKAFPLSYELEQQDVNRKVNLICTIGEYEIATSTK